MAQAYKKKIKLNTLIDKQKYMNHFTFIHSEVNETLFGVSCEIKITMWAYHFIDCKSCYGDRRT
jgi:hypothetical protein